jgi:hypothetical protein
LGVVLGAIRKANFMPVMVCLRQCVAGLHSPFGETRSVIRPGEPGGVKGRGFRYILDGMNAERLLIASECIGDAKWFAAKSMAYAQMR